MKKFLIIGLVALVAFVGCAKGTSAAVDAGDGIIAGTSAEVAGTEARVEETKTHEVAEKPVKAKAARKAGKGNTFTFTNSDGVQETLSTEFETKAIAPSKLPDDGVLARNVIFPEKPNDYIKALIIKQEVTAKANKFDPAVMDYYVTLSYEPVMADSEEAETRLEDLCYTGLNYEFKCDKDSLIPAQVSHFRILEENTAKYIDGQKNRPYEDIEIRFELGLENGELLTAGWDKGTDITLYCKDYTAYEWDPEFIYKTVEITPTGTIMFPEGDSSDYFRFYGYETRYVKAPGYGFIGKPVTVATGSISDEGFNLLQALLERVTVLPPEEVKNLIDGLTLNDLVMLLQDFSNGFSLESIVDSQAETYGLNAEELYSYLNSEEFPVDTGWDYGDLSEEEYKETYGLD